MNILILLFFLSCSKDNVSLQSESQGNNMLLIGNSFFGPYADNLEQLATEAGLKNHNTTVVKRGGELGRPINFWNDSTSEEHQLIKSTLDQGNIEFFGMTSGHDGDNPTQGHSAWIEYALKNNPNVIIFLAIAPFDFPADWNELVENNGFNSMEGMYDHYINEIIHKEIVDELRSEFPLTKIFTIPHGWAAVYLTQMHKDDLLLDNIDVFGPKPSSIFTDQKGHQGQIVIETGTMVWLNGIYNTDLTTFSYDTGFNTDLHTIAQDIINGHDVNYKQ